MPTALPSVMCNCKNVFTECLSGGHRSWPDGGSIERIRVANIHKFCKTKLSLNFPKVSDSSKCRGWLLIASTEEAHKM